MYMYTCTLLSLEIGVFGGLITPAFSFILSYNSPVYQVEILACFVFVWVPRMLKVVGLNPTQGSNSSLKKNYLVIWFLLLCSVCLKYLSLYHVYMYI